MKLKKGGYLLSGFLFGMLAFSSIKIMNIDAATNPKVSDKTGVYDEAFDLEITAAEGETVYITLDGSNPKTSSTRFIYENPINIYDRSSEKNYVSAVNPVLFDCANATYSSGKMGDKYSAPKDSDVDKATVVRAVSLDGDGNYSNVITNTYFVGSIADHIKGIKESADAAGIPLSIMSISVAYEDLFDYETGIYVKGKIFDEAFAEVPSSDKNNNKIVDATRKLPANYNQKGKEWEREAHIDYLESDGINTNAILSQDCGIRIQGNYSRSDLQKSFRLYARKDYGKKNFEYAFFGDKAKNDQGETIDEFKKLVLRNGGNDAFIAKYRDSYWQSLMNELACDTLASRACVVYLDGEYWGVYVLQEDYGDDYAKSHHGVTKDNVVTYKGDAEKNECGYEMDDGTLPRGVTDETYYMQELMNFFETHENCVKKEDYEALAKLVDVDSCIDYFAAEVYVNNKWDWPGKNWYIWKTTESYNKDNPMTDGKWRFVFCDLDFGGWSGSGEAYDLTIKQANYKPKGLLDMDTDNPVVLTFAYFMTNKEFIDKYEARLTEMFNEIFDIELCNERADQYHQTYCPLLGQFYDRYVGNAASGGDDAERYLGSAYGVSNTLKSFVKYRVNNLSRLIRFIDTTQAEYIEAANASGEGENESGNLQEENGSENKNTDNSSANDEISTAKKGSVISDKKYTYEVLTAGNTSGKLGTVKITGLKKKSLTVIKIASTVKINGITYKVVSIDAKAFMNNSKIKKVFVGKNVEVIGKSAFKNCKKLKAVTINSTVLKEIGSKAFFGDKKLTKVIIKSAKLKKVGKKAFYRKGGKKLKIKVLKSKKKKYKKLIKKSKANKYVVK